MNPDPQATMSKAEACTTIGVSLTSVDRLLRKGILQYTREGKRVRITRESVTAYMQGTWDEYWSTVERIAADGPLPDGARAIRLQRLFAAGTRRTPTVRAPLITPRNAA